MGENEKNSVFVVLHNMAMTDRPNDRSGTVITTKSLSEDDLINMAVALGTDINPSTYRAVLNRISKIARREIANGASVTYGLAHFKLEAKGVFYGDHPSWDSSKHFLAVRTTPTAEMRETARNTSVEVIGMAQSGIFINTVTDVATGEMNNLLTPGGGINISGSKIKVEGDSTDVGITFIHQTTRSITPVPPTSILTNKPSSITCIVPALAPGDYKIQITTQYGHSRHLNEPRTYMFDYPLHVGGGGTQEPDISNPQAPFE